MKFFIQIILSAGLLISLLNSGPDSLGILSLILGKVQINKVETGSWKKAALMSSVNNGDQVQTAKKSRCEIRLENKVVIRVGEKTNFIVTKDLEITHNVNVSKGNIWINLFSPNSKKKFKARTPTAVAALRGTVYRLSCGPNYSSFRVYAGSVLVSLLNEMGKEISDTTFIIKKGDEITVVKDFDDYKRQEREAFDIYLKEQRLGFEEYKRQQEIFFQEFKRKENEAFKKYKSLYVAVEKFDQEKDGKSDWVKWNQERDKLIKP